MLRLNFSVEDAAAVRFAISPVAETIGALRVFADPARHGSYRSWRSGLGGLGTDPVLGLLLDLVSPRAYVPDFLTPPSTMPVGDLQAELATIRATPPEIVRHELDLTFGGRTMDPLVGALYADPMMHLAEVVEALARWHAVAIDPWWDRLYAVLAAEVARQSHRLTQRGVGLMLRHLHPSICWQRGQLTVDTRWEARFRLGGQGLLLVPSAFWQGAGPILLGPWQPTLLYPASGVELIWETKRVEPSALAGVLGATRARLLTELEEPITTSELARRLRLTAPGVSQHLQRLRSAGLVTADRDGREVRYRRTHLATEIVRASRPQHDPLSDLERGEGRAPSAT